jgi:hypothetical protein
MLNNKPLPSLPKEATNNNSYKPNSKPNSNKHSNKRGSIFNSSSKVFLV